jgi:tRNA (guanine37-N1)-methyltransferase
MEVPKVLTSGNHKAIEIWRRWQQLEKTLEKRPDLLQKVNLSKLDKQILKNIQNKISFEEFLEKNFKIKL